MSEIERVASALCHLDASCSREDWVRIGMAAKSAGLEFDDFHNWSASAGNYSGEKSCRDAWKSFNESGGVTAASLFKMALDQGWQDPAKSSAKTNGSMLVKPTKAQHKPAKQAVNSNAVQVWERCIPADVSDAYIYKKRGIPDGLRVYPASAPPLFIGKDDDQINAAGGLVVPCYAPDGNTLLTLQIIPLVGAKKNLPGASFGNGFFTVGNIESADRTYICEGIGQAWAVTKADPKSAAVVCFGVGRMATVAKALREKHIAARLVLTPDRGKEEQAAEIAAAVNGEMVVMPADKPSNYDANDLMLESGAEVLAALLERPQVPPMRYNLLSVHDLAALPPYQWHIKGVLPATGLAALYGVSGSAKSFLVLDAAQAIADGKTWFGHRVKPCPVVYCALEGEGGIAGRVNAYRIRHGEIAENIRFLAQPFSLLDDEDIHDLARAIKAADAGAGVVVLTLQTPCVASCHRKAEIRNQCGMHWVKCSARLGTFDQKAHPSACPRVGRASVWKPPSRKSEAGWCANPNARLSAPNLPSVD